MGIRCKVVSCNSKQGDLPFHVLPRDPICQKEWLVRLGMPTNAYETEHERHSFRVCDLHFDEYARLGPLFVRSNSLREKALPTLFLTIYKGPSTQQTCVYIGEESLMANINVVEVDTIDDVEEVLGEDTAVVEEEAIEVISNNKVHEGSNQMVLGSKLNNTLQRKSKIRRKKNKMFLLKMLKETRKNNLPPKTRKLYEICCKIKKDLVRSRKENARLREQQQLFEKNVDDHLRNRLNRWSYVFVKSQLRLQKVHRNSRRFTMDEKVLALSFFKRSPKFYRMFKQIFSVPSKVTLTKLLYDFQVKDGVNSHILQQLQGAVNGMDSMGKFCILMFDEMTIQPALKYDIKHGKIIGFSTLKCREDKVIPDHVLVFMVRGINTPWKQPFSYYLSRGGLGSVDLKLLIKEQISILQSIGLKVVATVCDQHRSNVAAINNLRAETNAYFLRSGRENRLFGFRINDEEVVPLYDVPHLLKSFRNNFIRENIKFSWEGTTYEASWKDIIKEYELDQGRIDSYKIFPRLTDAHIYADKLKKMNVRLAAQVFSKTIARQFFYLIEHNAPSSSTLLGTAVILGQINDCFDSLNTSSSRGHSLKNVVEKTSAHLETWRNTIKLFNGMKFCKPSGTNPPTVSNFKHTLEGFCYLWRALQMQGFDTLCTRNLNQDPLENFFGRIRSHGTRDNNPTVYSFMGSFKALMVSCFFSPHSDRFNCEEDDCHNLFDSIKHFFTTSTPETESAEQEKAVLFTAVNAPPTRDLIALDGANAYVAGFVVKKILKYAKQCPTCHLQLVSGNREAEHFIIETRDLTTQKLLRPTSYFSFIFKYIFNFLTEHMPTLCRHPKVRQLLSSALVAHLNINLHCPNHQLQQILIKYSTDFYIFYWVKTINRALKGSDERVPDELIHDPIRILARRMYQTSKGARKKIAQIKNPA